MIEIVLEDSKFEQDIRPLVKAFFMTEEIVVNIGEAVENCECKLIVINRLDLIEVTLEFYDVSINKRKIVEDLERKLYKNELKKLIYLVLSEYTAKSLPWGTLTGIRPTKIALEFLEKGSSSSIIKEFYKDQYLCSDEKAKLSIDIARRELEILDRLDYRNGYSLYIGIPFCPTTCMYCSFTSYPIKKYEKMVEVYLKALFKEIDFVSKMLKKKLTTVYIGGGTPTAINEAELDQLIGYLHKKLPIKDVVEFTVEAGRADSITREKLKVLKDGGVSRISINPQTMSNETLKLIGRKHSREDVISAFNLARSMGFDNINMDLIIGLLGEEVKDVENTLVEIEKLSPDDLTVHSLAIKRAARLKLKLDEMKDLMPNDTAEQQRKTYEFAIKNGYFPYYLYRQKNIAENLENIGYAKKGKEGIYNILIMEERQSIIGLGAGSSSKYVFRNANRIERGENVKFVNDYIDRIDEMIERKKNFLEEFGEEL